MNKCTYFVRTHTHPESKILTFLKYISGPSFRLNDQASWFLGLFWVPFFYLQKALPMISMWLDLSARCCHMLGMLSLKWSHHCCHSCQSYCSKQFIIALKIQWADCLFSNTKTNRKGIKIWCSRDNSEWTNTTVLCLHYQSFHKQPKCTFSQLLSSVQLLCYTTWFWSGSLRTFSYF